VSDNVTMKIDGIFQCWGVYKIELFE